MEQKDIIEDWVNIRGYEGLYKISNKGLVWSVTSNKPMSPSKTGKKRNYLAISLSKDGKVKCFKIHRLVAIHFVPNPDDLPEVDHDNGNTFCNESWNLK